MVDAVLAAASSHRRELTDLCRNFWYSCWNAAVLIACGDGGGADATPAAKAWRKYRLLLARPSPCRAPRRRRVCSGDDGNGDHAAEGDDDDIGEGNE